MAAAKLHTLRPPPNLVGQLLTVPSPCTRSLRCSFRPCRKNRHVVSRSAAAAAVAAATAPELRPIQPQPAPLTAEGFVPRTAARAAVPGELQQLLGAAVEACRAELGDRLLGVYLRGSLVQPGCFLPGVSDADFMVLHLSGSQPSSGGSRSSSSDTGGGSGGDGSTDASAPAAVRLRQAAEQLRLQFLLCAKVELKAVEVQPGTALYPWAQCWQQQQQQPQQPAAGRQLDGALDSSAGQQAVAAWAALPPSALHDHASLAFQLKTQAVCLWGWDLPSLLPDVAALPPLDLLPALVDDVASAVMHCQRQLALASSAAHEDERAQAVAGAARAARWALKRCLRASLELCLAGSSAEEPQQRQVEPAQGRRLQQQQQRQQGIEQPQLPFWSRDLWWCAQGASLRIPELKDQLTDALARYVQLAGGTGSTLSGGTTAGGVAGEGHKPTATQHVQQRRDAVQAAARAAAELAARLDEAFLQQMLAEEPGWLTHHPGCSTVNSSLGGGSTSTGDGGTLQTPLPTSTAPRRKAGSSSGSWWKRLRVSLWAATAGGRMEEHLLGASPPPVAAAVQGPVLTLDWRQPQAREQAAALIAATLAQAAGSGSHTSSSGDTNGDSLSGPSQQRRPQPVLLKGAAAHWPAVQRWTLGHLAAARLEGRARLAPSLQFPFTEPRLAALLAEQHGPAALPSCLARMSAAEFAARMQQGNPCGLPPLVYAQQAAAGAAGGTVAAAAAAASEYAYFQAELPPSLLADCDLSSPPFAPPAGARSSSGGARPAMQQSQAARVWVGLQGSVSPTHYDLSQSFLTQIRGRKRMLFWGPDQLPFLYFYPDTHLLRRRSRVNVHAPQPGRFPLFERAAAQEALLEPGDVIFFPSRWAHYTESLDFSMSVTCRFAGVASAGSE